MILSRSKLEEVMARNYVKKDGLTPEQAAVRARADMEKSIVLGYVRAGSDDELIVEDQDALSRAETAVMNAKSLRS